MFDGYETYALVLVMLPAVHQLLPPERLPRAPVYIGGLLTATMVGWAVGGVAAGVVAEGAAAPVAGGVALLSWANAALDIRTIVATNVRYLEIIFWLLRLKFDIGDRSARTGQEH
jgi:hypothetical protein